MSASGFRQAALELERKANLSTLEQWDSFTHHRQRLTSLLVQDMPLGSASTLCVLGAGNCNDLDLPRLLQHYAEIHLVDLDAAALEQARTRPGVSDSSRLTIHAGLDLTAALDALPRWAALQVTAEALIAHPARAALQVAAALGRRFDRVLSPCVWTQFQLQALRALGDQHRLLDLVQYTLGLTHLRLLAELLATDGRALLVTELTANTTYDLGALEPDAEHLPLVAELVASGNAIGVATPERVVGPLLDDPTLRTQLVSSGPVCAWLWSQGPARQYLTYACWLHSLRSRAMPDRVT